LLLRLIDASTAPAAAPAREVEVDRLHADAALADAAVAFSAGARSRSRGVFGLDPRLRGADLRAQARAARDATER
jgi:hypothetical protein